MGQMSGVTHLARSSIEARRPLSVSPRSETLSDLADTPSDAADAR
jgi:hypothetical protein